MIVDQPLDLNRFNVSGQGLSYIQGNQPGQLDEQATKKRNCAVKPLSESVMRYLNYPTISIAAQDDQLAVIRGN